MNEQLAFFEDERTCILRKIVEPFQRKSMNKQEIQEQLKRNSMSGGTWQDGYNIAYWNNNVEIWGKAKVYKFSHNEIVNFAQ